VTGNYRVETEKKDDLKRGDGALHGLKKGFGNKKKRQRRAEKTREILVREQSHQNKSRGPNFD